MIGITSRTDIEQLTDNEVYSDVIVEAIDTLVHFASEKEFEEDMLRSFRSLIVNVCFTLMRTGKKEIEQMQNDPEEFVSLALDICDK